MAEDVCRAATFTDARGSIDSVVARGGARGARAPPVFFLKSKNRPV